MTPDLIPFILTVALNATLSTLLFKEWTWPRLRDLPIEKAARPILWFHAFRFFGLTFIAQGAVNSALPQNWAWDAAVGDLVTAMLAWLALFLKQGRTFHLCLWAFNLFGLLDILNAFAHGVPLQVQSLLGAAYFIPTLYVPPLVVTHIFLFILLWRNGKPTH